MERRLAAILAADLVGYSRLIEADEAGTLAALKSHREALIEPKIAQYHGRIVKLMGDGLLAEFPSAVEAVQCAVEIQHTMAERNANLPEERRATYRVGINIGDIVVEDDDIFGDGVNIAARLEGLADPGGICISRPVHTQIADKLDLEFEDLGEQQVKNIAKPVRVYRVALDEKSAALITPVSVMPPTTGRGRWPQIAAWFVLSVIAVTGLVWWQPWAPDVEPASLERMAFPLPDKPSIAVLPFANLSGDSGQELFSDGITNDIITDLSRFGDLMVIASNSTFSYKGKPTKVQQVAEELGVRYVLEGSIQRMGNQVRVNVQFVDAISGEHLWAERFDRELRDIFALQDEITQKVVATLGAYEGRVAEADRARAKRKKTTNLSAYELALLATEARHRFNKEDISKALELLERAVTLDPQYARAYVELAWAHYQGALNNWSESREVSTRKAHDSAQRAIEIDESFAEGHWVSGAIYAWLLREPEKSLAAYERALALNPNHADILADWGGYVLPKMLGRAEEGIEVVKKAMRLSPFYADWYDRALMNAYFVARRFEEAISTHQSVEYPTYNSRLRLVASYAHAGRLEEARTEAANFLKLKPGFSIGVWLQNEPPFEPYRSLLRDGLRKAGLPEHPPLPLPEKPSIAVLPFTNMSEDPEQEYFADGMTEDLITDLSKISGLFVIARNSSFSYKGQQVKVRQVAEELGVRYVVEGSVRRAGNEVRINAQLIDATTGGHLWAERFDGTLTDVFAVQDEITQRIASELAVIASADENERLFRRPATNFEAYELFLRARRTWEPPTRENIARGRALFEQVIERDPTFAGGYAGLSLMHALLVQFGYSETRDFDLDKAAQLARKALELDSGFGWAHTALGTVHLMRHKADAAVTQARAAIRAQPGDADAHSYLGYYLQFAGRGDEAIEAVENAMRLNPRFHSGRYSAFLALAEFQARRYADAIQTIEQHFDRFQSEASPNAVLWALLAAANHYLGHDDQARHVVEAMMTRFPELTIETWDFFGLYKRPEDTEHVLGPLRKLGFPVQGHQ